MTEQLRFESISEGSFRSRIESTNFQRRKIWFSWMNRLIIVPITPKLVFWVLREGHVTELLLELMDATFCAVAVDTIPTKRWFRLGATVDSTGAVMFSVKHAASCKMSTLVSNLRREERREERSANRGSFQPKKSIDKRMKDQIERGEERERRRTKVTGRKKDEKRKKKRKNPSKVSFHTKTTVSNEKLLS